MIKQTTTQGSQRKNRQQHREVSDKTDNDTGESEAKPTKTQGTRRGGVIEKTDNDTGKSVIKLTTTEGSQR